MKTKILIALLSIVILGCAERKVDKKAEGEKLMELSREWSRVAATNNVEKILSYWADDAIIMSSGLPAVQGKQSIRKMLEESFKIPGFKISWEPVNVFVSESGDIAYMVEQNQITVNDSLGNPVTQYNKGITVWRKEADGSWKNVIDIYNPDPSRTK